MARTEWQIYKMIHDAIPDWKPDGALYRPNDIFIRTKVSSQTKTQRADGQNSYTIPTTKYMDENITFTWYYDDGTMKTKIETYIEAHQELKIVDHNSIEYIGRFISISPAWLAGEDENRYDIQAVFEIMPLLTASSSSSVSSSSSSLSSSSSSCRSSSSSSSSSSESSSSSSSSSSCRSSSSSSSSSSKSSSSSSCRSSSSSSSSSSVGA